MRTVVGKAKSGPRGRRFGSLTEGQASRRIDTLRHVYDEGYIPQNIYESMKRDIEARAKRTT